MCPTPNMRTITNRVVHGVRAGSRSLVLSVCCLWLWLSVADLGGVRSLDLPGVSTSDSQDVCAASVRYPNIDSGKTDPKKYVIATNTSKYLPGVPLKVSVTGDEKFHGLTLQARHMDPALGRILSIGRFVGPHPATDRIYKCDVINDTVVTWSDTKNFSFEYTWIPPDESVGSVQFVANALADRSTLDTNITSDRISLGFVPIDLSGCGTIKGCYRYPGRDETEACTGQTCEYVVTYKRVKGYAHFEMSAEADWVAVGFSSDDKMGGDDVFMCVRQSMGGDVRHYWNDIGYQPPTYRSDNPLTDTHVDVSPERNRISCRFRRKMTVSGKFNIDLENDWYQLYAWGPVSNSGSIQRHYLDRPPASKTKLILSSRHDVTGSASSVSASVSHTIIACITTLVITCLCPMTSVVASVPTKNTIYKV